MSVVNPLRLPLIAGRVRAYFAPVDRIAGVPTAFDAAANAGRVLNAPAAPWVDLGWVQGFVRKSESKVLEVDTGSPATVQVQAWQKVGATVACQFTSWSRLAMALATGSDSVNLFAPGSATWPVGAGSNASVLYLSGASQLSAGSLVVVDGDYTGQTGYVGAGAAANYVRNAAAFAGNTSYVRRYSLNVGQVSSVGADGGLQLAGPLLAGVPTSAMKAQAIVGFGDREGGLFFPEWSGLFVMLGAQGERVFFYYPRLQVMSGAKESAQVLSAPFQSVLLDASFRALPVPDSVDGTATVCYRSFVPGSACRI